MAWSFMILYFIALDGKLECPMDFCEWLDQWGFKDLAMCYIFYKKKMWYIKKKKVAQHYIAFWEYKVGVNN